MQSGLAFDAEPRGTLRIDGGRLGLTEGLLLRRRFLSAVAFFAARSLVMSGLGKITRRQRGWLSGYSYPTSIGTTSPFASVLSSCAVRPQVLSLRHGGT
jgi:hypothetical protein